MFDVTRIMFDNYYNVFDKNNYNVDDKNNNNVDVNII